jgi:DNA repair photolyase
MAAIYEPKGKAREYSPLALNLYKGCAHGCVYCYAPSATFTDRATFSDPAYIRPRPGIIQQLFTDAFRLQGDRREILISFTSDCYQAEEAERGVTREALQILRFFKLRPTILSKAGSLARRDFDVLSSISGAAFAVTLTTDDQGESLRWEPGAALPEDRIDNLKAARAAGISTWVSFEPVVNPEAVYRLIERVAPIVDLIKVGKLNYHPAAQGIDWPRFREQVSALLKKTGKPYYLKEDLRRAK